MTHLQQFHRYAFIALLFIGGCAGNLTRTDTSPEAMIKTGADSHAAVTTLATVTLKNGKMTVDQAKSYRVMLGAASTTLDSANATLLACRKTTGSTSAASPDPCRPQVADLIKLALDSIANAKNSLEAK